MSKLLRQIITGALGIAFGFSAGMVFDYKNSRKIISKKEAEIRRCKGYFNTLSQWLELRDKNISVAGYLLRHGYRTVAVYGLGELGQHLCKELSDAGINIKYGIDKNADEKEPGDFCNGIQIWDLGHEFNGVDAVIVTLPHVFKNLRGILSEKLGCPVLDLERILFEAMN